jgi:endonuclease/exonuclease/phosphatase (EEP) superfamily protein YafD
MQQLAEDALSADADLLSMQEIRPETFPDIDAVLHQKYPYSKVSLDIKGFGIALYSRYPIKEDSTYIVNRFPVLTGVVEVPGGKVRYVCATISTPKSEKGFERQTKEFQLLAQLIRQDTLPVILIGDLNTVPWSTQMEFLLQKARLKDSRKDLAATFPSQSVLVQIPIDYILHGERLECLDFHTLSKSTSNHLGIMGYYTFIQK